MELQEDECVRDDNERYLTRLSSSVSNRSGRSAKSGDPKQPSVGSVGVASSPRRSQRIGQDPNGVDNDKDELLHVLVSRPAVAGKPRDNIIFEGDMDLRTTFETSYEALAKMRLDCWRKYQASKDRLESKSPVEYGHEFTSAQDRQLNSSTNRTPEVSVNSNQFDYYNKLMSREYNLNSTDEGPKLMANNNNNNYTNKTNRTGTASERRGPNKSEGPKSGTPISFSRAIGPQHYTPEAAADTAKTQRASRGTRSVAAQVMETDLTTVTPKISSDTFNRFDSSGLPQTGGPSSRTTPVNDNSSHIDPDLAPIIVYDSNMNRLERVGLRKRSKYRPSTSLRPGARGLFGDQSVEDTAATTVKADRSVQNQSPAPNYEKDQQHYLKHAAGTSTANNFTGGESPDSEQKLDPRARQVLNARNLSGSHQPNNLTFSQQNLPIDSKRKVKDNINMTDHIKEQDIVTGAKRVRNVSTSTGDEVNLDDFYNTKSEDNELFEWHQEGERPETRANDFENLKSDQEENKKLYELEEAEAVAEIQRITNTSGQKQSDDAIGSAVMRGNVGTKLSRVEDKALDSMHERLQKTCQQQNFCLFENDYPEAKEKTSGARRSNVDASGNLTPNPPSRNYKNLFRESPDFIMTTGILERHQSLVSPSANATPLLTSGEKANETTTTLATKDNSPSDRCRVLDLNEEYQFVESRAGHKYFIQKPTSPAKV